MQGKIDRLFDIVNIKRTALWQGPERWAML
jgi:hypothetical protein